MHPMARISSLPEELLLKIFKCINSNQQLAHCRLVCAQWSRSADKAMFSNTLVLKSPEKALALYVQLYNNPPKGKLVQHVYIDASFDVFSILKSMLIEAFLPNIKAFSGETTNPGFYSMLLDVVRKSPTALKNLTTLPKYNLDVDQTYHDVLLAIKDTLSEIDINNERKYMSSFMTDLASHFSSFINLKTLKLCAVFLQLSDLDLLLEGCIHLTALDLDIVMEGISSMVEADLDAWVASGDITQMRNVQQLTIRHECRAYVIEYLVYKCPNVNHIKVDSDYQVRTTAISSEIHISWNNVDMTRNRMDRIFQAIKGIPLKEVKYWVAGNADLLETTDYISQKGYQLLVFNKEQHPPFIRIEVEGL
ncbi:hypothetical protein MBANPS3_004825 [Mucor bainieri]